MTDHRFDDDDASDPSEATMIVDTRDLKQAAAQQQTERDQAYLIVMSGPHVGKMFKVDKDETTIGRSTKADMYVNDVGISRRHARLIIWGEDVFVEDLESANGTYLNGELLSRRVQLQDGDKITLGSSTILKFTYHDRLDEDFQKQMFDAALRDGLTGAYNKNFLINHLTTEVAFALRNGTALSVIMFDVDHFKPVNDNHGHLAGDSILKRLAEISLATLRTEDVFARYGGEEFTIVSRGIDMERAAIIAERLRQIVQNTTFVFDGKHIPITISLGVAALPEIPAQTSDDLIGAADKALYASKHGGRNRVSVAMAEDER
jgi:two-component system, cell cycle response regulator